MLWMMMARIFDENFKKISSVNSLHESKNVLLASSLCYVWSCSHQVIKEPAGWSVSVKSAQVLFLLTEFSYLERSSSR